MIWKKYFSYSFKSALLKEGNRVYISIPFNVWETCGQKWLISVKVEISGNIFECKLVPKGNGKYLIPITKEFYENIINPLDEIDVQFKLSDGLSRINSINPYTKENPIRKIDCINYIQQPMLMSKCSICLRILPISLQFS